MFRPFSLSLQDELLKRFPLSSEGMQYIKKALTAPSRNVGGTTRNMPSNIPNPKMGMTTQSESKSGERPHILSYTFDSNCVGFTTQPPSIELLYKGRNNQTVRTNYTPDCLVFDSNRGVIVEEWKPANERDKLHDLYPGKYCKHADGRYGSEAIEAVLRPMGIHFQLRFSDEVSPFAHQNHQFLYTYLQPAAEGKYLPLLPDVLASFKNFGQRVLADLIEEGVDRDAIYWAMATGRIYFDFNAASLADRSDATQLFAHEITFKAWNIAIRPDGVRPTLSVEFHEQDLKAGDIFLLDGKRLTVRFVGNTSVLARAEDGTTTDIEFNDLYVASTANKLVIPNAHRKAVASRFYSASPAALGRAIRHAEILQKIDHHESLLSEEKYAPSTIRRWQKKVREGLALGLSPVESLIDEVAHRGYHGPHIDAALSMRLDADISAALKDEKAPTKISIYADIEKAWGQAQLKMVSKSTFYERVKLLESPATIRASRGHKAAYQLEPAHWILDGSTPVHAERAMQWLHIDSTLLDVELRSSLSGEVLGRPWLTLAICGYCRRVMGFHLSFRPPSYFSSMGVLADVIQRCGRLPDAVIHDWGSEFKKKEFKECLSALFIERFVRPKSAPRFGAVIERMFGIATQRLIANLAGNTKARKNVRALSPSADPTTHSGLWLIDIFVGLEEFFFSSTYNGKKHPTTLLTPDAMYEASFIQHGARLHRLKSLNAILPLISPYARGSARYLDSARGLHVNYRPYSHPVLADRARNGQSILVKLPPFDPTEILAFVDGQWITCRTPGDAFINMASPLVKRCMNEEWSIEQHLVRADSDSARRDLTGLIDKLNQRAIENKEYWKEREFREVLKTAVFSPPLPELLPTTKTGVQKLHESMERAIALALSVGSQEHASC